MPAPTTPPLTARDVCSGLEQEVNAIARANKTHTNLFEVECMKFAVSVGLLIGCDVWEILDGYIAF